MALLQTNALLLLVVLLTLASENASAKRYGGGGVGKIVGGSKKLAGKNAGASTGSLQPVRSYGAGYADSSKFASTSTSYGGRYSRYPNGGYRSGSWAFFFLYGGHMRQTTGSDGDDDGDDDDDYERFFDRLENGCQLTGVASYRTIDHNNPDAPDSMSGRSSSATGDDDDDDWVGCIEEWTYTVEVVGGNATYDTVFVSPPVELYACDRNDTCAQCQDELRGTDFDALALEAVEFSGDANDPYVDCFVPKKNLNRVNKTFDCYNEECVFLSEKYEYVSSSAANGPGFAATLAMVGGFVVAVLGLCC